MTYSNDSEGTGSPRPSPRRLVTYGKPGRRHTDTDNSSLAIPDAKQAEPSNFVMLGHKQSATQLPARNVAVSSRVIQEHTHRGSKDGQDDFSSTLNGSEKATGNSKDDAHLKRTHAQAFSANSRRNRPQAGRNELKTARTPGRQPQSPSLDKGNQSVLELRASYQHPIELHSSGSVSSRSLGPKASPFRPSPPSTGSNQNPSNTSPASTSTVKLRRKRLIDTLAAQRDASPDSDMSDSPVDRARTRPSHIEDKFATQSPRTNFSRDVRTTQRAGESSSKKKIKFTYSHARTIRSDVQDQGSLTTAPPITDNDSFFSDPLAMPSPGAFDFDGDSEEDDGDGAAKVAIKSVHELRRAGANNRFADEMEDLLLRIGKPGKSYSNMRRNGLFDLAQKLQHTEFANQFQDHGTRDNFVSGIGDDEDTIAGFGVCAVLVIFLSIGSAPHLLQQVTREGVGRLLSRLLQIKTDIDDIANDRKNNMMKSNQSTLRSLKRALIRRNIWHGFECKSLSPRRLALQFLDMFVRRADAPSVSVVTREAEDGLFSVANTFIDTEVDEDVDFALLVSILEAQSNLTTSLDETILDVTRWSLPVAACLERILQRWPNNDSKMTEATTIKLAINTTNATGGAAAFDRPNLLVHLVKCICEGFLKAKVAVGNGGLDSDLYDGLLLILGVGINIFEHCPAARRSIDGISQTKLVQLYSDNYASMAEVRYSLLPTVFS